MNIASSRDRVLFPKRKSRHYFKFTTVILLLHPFDFETRDCFVKLKQQNEEGVSKIQP